MFSCVSWLAPSLVFVHSRDGDSSHPHPVQSLLHWYIGVCWTGGVAALTASATAPTLISGCRSYVATLGEGTSCLSSRSNAISRPPLKKKVTWAYFSVSKGGQTRCVIARSLTGVGCRASELSSNI